METKLSSNNLDYKRLMEQQRNSVNNGNNNSVEKKAIEFDLKIVSFVLGEQNYAIDIMAVKEIINASHFTRIPNALDFVMGVLNIRGEIIPIINLCKMFHLKEMEKKDDECQIIVIKIDSLSIGLVVDKISQVLPLRKSDIQPPSPLLGGINERYIAGVVELNSKLYVILDIEYIFSDKEKAKHATLSQNVNFNEEVFSYFCSQIEELAAIHINDYNKSGFAKVYSEYSQTLNGADMPKLDTNTANALVSGVKSNYTGAMWDIPYTDHFTNSVLKQVGKICKDSIKVLDLGCASGHEAFSLFMLISQQLEDLPIKMIGADSNLNSVTEALNFEITANEIPQWINKDKFFVKLGDSTYKVKREILDQICFEFHNAINVDTYQNNFDLVVARDLSLYTSTEDYKTFIEKISSKITKGGILVIGDKEEILENNDFEKIDNENLQIFMKK